MVFAVVVPSLFLFVERLGVISVGAAPTQLLGGSVIRLAPQLDARGLAIIFEIGKGVAAGHGRLRLAASGGLVALLFKQLVASA
jgi:hypothetical protein